MAKWKNVALISTIIAPIAFGAAPVGEALADSTRPTETNVVIHKMLSNQSYAADYYWGDGTASAGEAAFPAAEGWDSNANGYTFTAYALPGNVIEIDSTGKPVVTSATVTVAGSTVAWADILKVRKVVTSATTDPAEVNPATSASGLSSAAAATSGHVSPYTITLASAYTADSSQAALMSALGSSAATADIEAGTGTMKLKNDEYIIFETGKPAGDITTAAPIVLNLPMAYAGSAGWFGTDSGAELNVYPKDLVKNGDLTVVKQDEETGDLLNGAEFLAFSDASLASFVSSALAANTHFNAAGSVVTSGGSTIPEMTTTQVESLFASAAPTASLNSATSMSSGSYHFSPLTPGTSYYVMETKAPSGFIEDDNLRSVFLSMDKPGDSDANDGSAYFSGGILEFGNWDDLQADKYVNTVSPQGSTVNSGFDFSSFDAGVQSGFSAGDFTTDSMSAGSIASLADDSHGVTRGQYFQYAVDTEINSNLALDYTEYTIIDDIPSNISIYNFVIGVEVAGEYTPLAAVELGVNNGTTTVSQEGAGGFNGAGGSYEILSFQAAPGTGLTESDIAITGTAPTYSVDKNGVASGTDGQLQIALVQGDKNMLNQIMTAATPGGTFNTDAKVRTVFTAAANSSVNFGDITNKATLEYLTKSTPGSDGGQATTFSAGWELLKLDDVNGDPLADVGFQLSKIGLAADQIKSQLLQTNNPAFGWYAADGKTLTDTGKNAQYNMAYRLTSSTSGNGWMIDSKTPTTAEAALAALGTIPETYADTTVRDAVVEAMVNLLAEQGASPTVKLYAVYLGNDGAPVAKIAGDAEKGALLWTPYKALATTQVSTSTGYLQVTGLEEGNYTLSETIVPAGFAKHDDVNFWVGRDASDHTSSDFAMLTAAARTTTAGNVAATSMATDTEMSGNEGTTTATTDAEVHGEITNHVKSIFPLTGGIGAALVMLLGVLGMAYATIKRRFEKRAAVKVTEED